MNRRQFVLAGAGLAASTVLARRLSAADAPGNVEIAIIGAGLFGAAAARHVSAICDDVALIGPSEPARRREHQGVFASHYDESRLVRGIDPDLTWATLAKRSIERYRDIERESGINSYSDVGYLMVTPGGLGDDWFDLPAMRQVAEHLDVAIVDLDDDALRARFPYLDYTPGSSAILQSHDAGYINPRQLLEAQKRIGASNGATLIDDIVVQLRRDGKQVLVGTKSGNTIRANKVLIATGAYANASGLLPRKLDVSIRAAMIMESEVAPQTRATYPPTLYAKTDGKDDFWGLLMPPVVYPNGRRYVKTMDGYYGPAPLEGFEELGNWSRSDGHRGHRHVLKRALSEVFPSLEVLATHFKPCLIMDTASHYPYIDMLDDRIGLVVGGNGKAAKSSDEIGRIAANMIGNDDWPASLPHSAFAAVYV